MELGWWRDFRGVSVGGNGGVGWGGGEKVNGRGREQFSRFGQTFKSVNRNNIYCLFV